MRAPTSGARDREWAWASGSERSCSAGGAKIAEQHRIEIEHVQSDAKTVVTSAPEALTWLNAQLDREGVVKKRELPMGSLAVGRDDHD
jgi:hypothetical protein